MDQRIISKVIINFINKFVYGPVKIMSKEYIKQVYDLTLEKLKDTATIYEEYHEIEKVLAGK